MKTTKNKKLLDKQELKNLASYIMAALIWTLFSLRICIYSHEILWSFFMVPTGFIPLIWEIVISSKYQNEYSSQKINSKILLDKSNVYNKEKDKKANLSNNQKPGT
jgi:hypothetical protein